MWKEAYLESRILSANPLELVNLLYQGAIDSLHDARKYLAEGDIPARSQALAKATDILTELEASLNHQAGGSISIALADLYQYMRLRLLEANIRKDGAIMAEVQALLVTMAEAWKTIQKASEVASVGTTVGTTDDAPAVPVPAAAWGGAFEPGRGTEYAAHGWSA